MKKICLVLIAVAFVIGAVNMINAGPVTTEQGATNAKQIKISGEMDTPMVSRDKGINSVLDGAIGSPQDSDVIWSPLITLNLGIDVGDKITSLIQLQNRQLDTAVGTGANADFLGGDNLDPAVKQALIKLEKFIIQDLTFTYGLQNLKVTLREDGGAFFMDTGYGSSNVINGFLTEGVAGVGRNKDRNEFGGFRFDYSSLKNNNYQGVLFVGKIAETATGKDVLHNDTMLNGAVGWYKIGDEKIVNAILAQIFNAKNGTNIQTIGVGATYPGALPNLDAYGEFYSQSGKNLKSENQSASAYRIGAKYDIQHTLKPYVDLSYWFLSGGGQAAGGTNKNFVSLENVKSTMILEDDVFGLDLDSNYGAIKVESGVTTKIDLDKDGSPEEVRVKLLIGSFTLADQPRGKASISDGLGTEIDLLIALQYNPSLGFTLGYATLTGGKFFTDPASYNAKESTMGLIIFGTNLKF